MTENQGKFIIKILMFALGIAVHRIFWVLPDEQDNMLNSYHKLKNDYENGQVY